MTDHEELAHVLRCRALPVTGRSADGALLDAVMHLDETPAVEPLDPVQPAAAEPFETYPPAF